MKNSELVKGLVEMGDPVYKVVANILMCDEDSGLGRIFLSDLKIAAAVVMEIRDISNRDLAKISALDKENSEWSKSR